MSTDTFYVEIDLTSSDFEDGLYPEIPNMLRNIVEGMLYDKNYAGELQDSKGKHIGYFGAG